MARCSRCSREMRPHGTRKEDAPDTVVAMARGLCAGCYKPSMRPPAEPTDDNSPCVLVRAYLRPSTWRLLTRFAKENDCEVGAVLSILADRAVMKPAPTVRRAHEHVEDEIDARIREMNAQLKSDAEIARELGMAQPTIWRRRKNLGLTPARQLRSAAKHAA